MTLRHQPDRYLTRARGGTVYELNCYRCGQPGHIKANCPDAPAFPPLPPDGGAEATYMPPPYAGARMLAAPPSAEYLDAKTRLGLPPASDVLTVACPWCGVRAYAPCINPGTGAPKLISHDARFEMAADHANA